jgi:formylglycine-generating enzyme required for sulfatase activity
MHIRCPHCHNAIDVIPEADLDPVVCSSCGSSFRLVPDDAATTVDARHRRYGHFELLERIGVGQFGFVWKARDTTLDRIVAIKIPRRDAVGPQEAESFLREARAAGQLRHPNIVAVHEVGRLEEQLYIVSDYIEGANLREWLVGRRMATREVAALCATIADALQHAHQKGVIHRDLKPGNIMMDAQGRPHVLDFGLAKRETGEITMTIDGKVLGTPAYMPPEQAKGDSHTVDGRADVYSLGVMLFELLSGKLPFRGERRMLLIQIQQDNPPSLRRLDSRIPRDLETICLKCLRKQPKDRYQNASDLADDLKRWLHNEPIRARPVSAIAKARLWCQRNLALTIALVAAIALVAVIVSQYRARQYVQWETRLASAESLVEAAMTGPASAVPSAAKTLQPLTEHAIPLLRNRLADQQTFGWRRVRVACLLAALGDADVSVVFQELRRDSSWNEFEITLLALQRNKARALKLLEEESRIVRLNNPYSSDHNLRYQARLAILALHLGNYELAADMLKVVGRTNPIARTTFINVLPEWHGDLAQLAKAIDDELDGDTRSGLCLAMGGISLNQLDERERLAWQPTLQEWHAHKPDGSTHSASGWLIEKWKLELPPLSRNGRPTTGREWWYAWERLTFLRVSPGTFIRKKTGYPKWHQVVELTHDYWLSDREITVSLYRDFVNDQSYPIEQKPAYDRLRGISHDVRDKELASHPKLFVNWFEAVMFCNWLSTKLNLHPYYEVRQTIDTVPEVLTEFEELYMPEKKKLTRQIVSVSVKTLANDGIRLPTEAEWEYACQAGTTTRHSAGYDYRDVADYSWFRDAYTPVEYFKFCAWKRCNGWGFFDMHGNAKEWCADWYGEYCDAGPVKDPQGPSHGEYRVIRGNSFGDDLWTVNSSERGMSLPTNREVDAGFRIARSIGAGER